jgi:magnesium chelatase subunit D
MEDTKRPDLERVAAALCLHPALRALLVLDADAARLRTLAENMRTWLAARLGVKVQLRIPGGYLGDDDLWGLPPLVTEQATDTATTGNQPGTGPRLPDGLLRLLGHPGVLLPDPASSDWTLVLIPDLTKVGPALARATLQLIGPDDVHLERHGRSACFQNRTFWLAGCRTADASQVSPHLMERFAVRVSDERPAPDRTSALHAILEPTTEIGFSGTIPLPRADARPLPTLSDQAAERLGSLLEGPISRSLHLDLGLARLATALAMLEGATQVGPEHLDQAIAASEPADATAAHANDEGRGANEQPKEEPVGPKFIETDQTPKTDDESDAETSGDGDLTDTADTEPGSVSAERADREVEGQPIHQRAPARTTDSETESDTGTGVPLPLQRNPVQRSAYGEITGIERARPGEPIAIISTLFAAAPWQSWRRRKASPGTKGLLVEIADLRKWRRAIPSEGLLVLLLDLTAVRDHDWQSVVGWELQNAYQRRSPVSLILVGADPRQKDPPEAEIHAERIDCRSILVPELDNALRRKSGRATPLADGLHLALEALTAIRRKGLSRKERVRFALITDGRGNIPLRMSRGGGSIWPVGRLGIDDALKVARQLSALPAVETRLYAPKPRFAPQILDALILALGLSEAKILEPLVRASRP